MAKFNIYLKNPTAAGETALYLQIYSGSNKLKYYFGESLNPLFWDAKNQKAVKTKNAPELNTTLAAIKLKAEKAANRLAAELNTTPTPKQIRDEIQRLDEIESGKYQTKETPKDLLTFFAHVAEQIPQRVNERTNKPLAATTARIYKQTLRVLKEYQKDKRCKLDFDSIDLDFYFSFKSYLEKKQMFSANTVGKHIKQLKTVMNEATQLGLNTNQKYKSTRFKAIAEDTNHVYLNEKELHELQILDLSTNPRLSRVRDLFILGCWTGLRFSDFTRLNIAKIITDRDGNKYFEIQTQKTNEMVTIPVLPQIQSILNLYGGIDTLTLPEKISNQKLNEYLKEIAQMVDSLNVPFSKERTKAGIKTSTQKMKWEYVSSHAARRSFASNMFLRGNIPVPLIMAITGHKSEKQFYKYIQMNPKEKATMFRQMFFESSPLKVAK